MADVYLLQKANPRSTDAVSSVTCPEDLEVEIMGALEVEEAVPRVRKQAFLPQIFEQTMPHLRYQRWLTSAMVHHCRKWQ